MTRSRTPQITAAATGLAILGGGALFTGVPAAVIGAFQERAWLLAGLGYGSLAILAIWIAIRLPRRPDDLPLRRLAWAVPVGMFLLLGLRFTFLPARLPLSLVEGALGLLGLLCAVQLAALPPIRSSGGAPDE